MSTLGIYNCGVTHPSKVLLKLYNAGKFDITFQTNSKCVSAHKLILSANSDYFVKMFDEQYQVKEVLYPDIDGDALEQCIKFCYTGQITFTEENIFDVIIISKLMKFNAIEKEGWKNLKKNLRPDNIMEIIAFADFQSNNQMVQNCLQNAMANISKITELEGFKVLEQEHLLNFMKQAKKFKLVSDESMLDVFKSWINVHPDERQKSATEFLTCFDLQKGTMEFLWNKVRHFCKDEESMKIFEEAMNFHLFSNKDQSPKDPILSSTSNVMEPKLEALKFIEGTCIWLRVTISGDNFLYSYCPNKDVFTKILPSLQNSIGYQNVKWGNRILDLDNNRVRIFDTLTKEWTELAKMDGNTVYSFVINDKVYAISETLLIFKYDFTNLIWKKFGAPWATNLPETGASFIVQDDKLYVVGGGNTIFPMKAFDFKTGSWTKLARPFESTNCFRLAFCKGFLYAFPGSITSTEEMKPMSNTIQKYDVANNQWTRLPGWSLYEQPLYVYAAQEHIFLITTHHNIVSYDVKSNLIDKLTNFQQRLKSISAVFINSEQST